MLELLTCPLFIAIRHWSVIDLINIWEPIDDESTQKHSIGYLVTFNRQTGQVCKCLKFRDLNKTVDVVVLEE